MGPYGGEMMDQDLNEAGYDADLFASFEDYDDDDDDDDYFYHFQPPMSTDEQALVGISNQPPPSQDAGQAAYMQYGEDIHA